MKAAVVYYSGTGNTEQMADILSDALSERYETEVFTSGEFSRSTADYDVLAFGCPAMGQEVLEESEFEPMFSDTEGGLRDKKVILFGSYGWGDGEWMRNWEERCIADGADVAGTVICQDAPDAETEDSLRALAESL